MEAIKFTDVNFTYPLCEKKALDNINLSVDMSEFIVLCGKSGCGKSTLLRHLKKNLTPYGYREGSIRYRGEEIAELEDRLSVSEIGYVQQNPDNQIVTDKVWHELAFGLESLGFDNASIRRRVAEMANFFDIQGWFRKSVTELSGGQKQLLNLASVMVMQPKVLILDEPAAQLDPIAASEFMRTLYRINRELGTTVIISEHRLEELFPMADRVAVMDEGKIICCDSPRNVGTALAAAEHPMFYGLPAVMKIYAQTGAGGKCPMTIRDGRLWLESILGEPEEKACDKKDEKEKSREYKKEKKKKTDEEYIIDARDVYFSYDRNSGEVLRGLNLKVKKGEWYCLLGGNGAGKSTTLKVLCGILKPQRGNVTIDGLDIKKTGRRLFEGRLAMVPQNPQALFTEITVEEELLEALYYSKEADSEKVKAASDMMEQMELSHLAKAHPYDLSGGEQQRLALGKILLLKPRILILDEPTKGLDPFFKRTLAQIFKGLVERGVTIFMVSHDIEFCAEYADRCAMFFDGDIVSEGEPQAFFSGNSFYTTVSNRMARGWFPKAVTWEEALQCVRDSM